MSCGEIQYSQSYTDEITFTATSDSSHISGWLVRVQGTDYNEIESKITGIRIVDDRTTEITIKLEKKVPISQGIPHISLTVSNEAFVSEMEEE